METPSETTPFSGNMSVEIKRQYSYTTLATLIGKGDSVPESPATPSPSGAVQMKKVVNRLDEIDTESRELLQTLFSTLERDTRLERYVRGRLEDPKAIRIWEMVQNVLSTHHGHVDVDAILNHNKNNDDENETVLVNKVRELKINGENDYDDEMRLERFKTRTLDIVDVIEESKN